VREKEIFLKALEISDPKQRTRFVKEKCSSSKELYSRVTELLKESTIDGAFLETPAINSLFPSFQLNDGLTESGIPILEEGEWLANYRIDKLIGEGGCGLVYMAEQKHPIRRMVAVKVLKPGLIRQNNAAGFEAERQFMAGMDHPFITRIFDAGETEDGRPYFRACPIAA